MKFLGSLITLLFIGFMQAQTDGEAVVQRQLDTYNARDIEGFLATFSDSAKIYAFGNPTPLAIGKEAIRSIYSKMFNDSPNLHSTLVNRIVFENKIFDHESITGRNGSSEPLELVMLYIVKNGVIVEAHSIRK